jgi:hypothetical protein
MPCRFLAGSEHGLARRACLPTLLAKSVVGKILDGNREPLAQITWPSRETAANGNLTQELGELCHKNATRIRIGDSLQLVSSRPTARSTCCQSLQVELLAHVDRCRPLLDPVEALASLLSGRCVQ